MEEQQAQQSQPKEEQSAPQAAPVAGEKMGNPAEVEKGKIWAILGYIFGILFFLPLVMDDLKNNTFSKFHSNQQLVLLIFWVVFSFANGVLLFIPIIGWLLIPIIWIFGFILVVMGVINASQGKMKELPLLGQITLLK